jgi:hypothetical protein
MSKLRWFRCFPVNFLEGTRGMRPLLFKTYTRLLMALYDEGGSLDARNTRRLAWLLEIRIQDVARLLNELAALGKIEIRNGHIHNRRTDDEIKHQIMEPNAYPKPQVEPHLPLWSSKKPNKNYVRAGDRGDTRRQKDISPSEISAPSPKKPTPRQELETCLDHAHAEAVIEHRQRMRRPLTAHAARLLAGKFGRTGDPNASADAMIANGWQGFEPAWLTKKHDPPSRKRNFVDAALDRINGHDDTASLFDDHRDAERLPTGRQQPRSAAEDLRSGAEGHRKPGHH